MVERERSLNLLAAGAHARVGLVRSGARLRQELRGADKVAADVRVNRLRPARFRLAGKRIYEVAGQAEPDGGARECGQVDDRELHVASAVQELEQLVRKLGCSLALGGEGEDVGAAGDCEAGRLNVADGSGRSERLFCIGESANSVLPG